jgi:hypothetical protein
LPVVPWAENRWLSIEQITETGKIESAGNICRVTREGGRSMATKLIAKESRGEKPAARKAPAKKGGASKKAAPNGPAASAGAENEGGDLRSTLSSSRTASAIWSRIVKADQANLTPELARIILKFGFDPEDHRRIEELSAKAQKGTLTPDERAELEEYVRVNTQLTILQSKARLSLKRAKKSP